MTAFLLAASVAAPIMGRLGDSHGKRRMLLVSLVLLATGSLVAALAPTITVMIIARIVQGAGGGCLPLAFGIILTNSLRNVARSPVPMSLVLRHFAPAPNPHQQWQRAGLGYSGWLIVGRDLLEVAVDDL